jgi:hypothetical protein
VTNGGKNRQAIHSQSRAAGISPGRHAIRPVLFRGGQRGALARGIIKLRLQYKFQSSRFTPFISCHLIQLGYSVSSGGFAHKFLLKCLDPLVLFGQPLFLSLLAIDLAGYKFTRIFCEKGIFALDLDSIVLIL